MYHPSDDFKAWVADDGSRYGLFEHFVEIDRNMTKAEQDSLHGTIEAENGDFRHGNITVKIKGA